MVNVRPAGTVKLLVTTYGPWLAVQVVSAPSVPLAFTTDPSSYQMSTDVRSTSTEPGPNACTNNRLIPGRNGTFVIPHVPCQCVSVANPPFTRTDRISIAFTNPVTTANAEVVRGKPLLIVINGLFATKVCGICP